MDIKHIADLSSWKRGMDADSLIITDCITTRGNESDGNKLPKLIRGSPKDITADKSYDSNDNHNELKDRGIHSSIILKGNRVEPAVLNLANTESQKERPKIEPKFSKEKNRHGMKKCRYWGGDAYVIIFRYVRNNVSNVL